MKTRTTRHNTRTYEGGFLDEVSYEVHGARHGAVGLSRTVKYAYS